MDSPAGSDDDHVSILITSSLLEHPVLPQVEARDSVGALLRILDRAKLGFDGDSTRSNDLTQLILGVHRDSDVFRELFDDQETAELDGAGAPP